MYIYLYCSLFTEEQGDFHCWKFSSRISHCSNPAPVTEELGEERFLLKINTGRLVIKTFFCLQLPAQKAPSLLILSPQVLAAEGCCPLAHAAAVVHPPPSLSALVVPAIGDGCEWHLRRCCWIPWVNGATRVCACALCRTAGPKIRSAEMMTQNWQLKRPDSGGSGTSALSFCTAQGF